LGGSGKAVRRRYAGVNLAYIIGKSKKRRKNLSKAGEKSSPTKLFRHIQRDS
jgi:hypothetical protein